MKRNRSSLAACAVFLGAFLGVVRPTFADQPAPSVPTTAPLDVVLTKDGGMMRGTIVEKKAGDWVTIQLVTGETRKINLAEVTYAGPSSQMPGASPVPPTETARPLVTVHSGEARLVLRAPQPLGFHIRTGEASIVGTGYTFGRQGGATIFGATAASYTPICVTPCEASVPAGTHRLALSMDGGPPVEPDYAITLRPGVTELHGAYNSFAGTRIAGWLLVVCGALAGSVLIYDSFKRDLVGYGSHVDNTELGLGLGIGVLAPIVGWILTMKGDEATIRAVSPASAARP